MEKVYEAPMLSVMGAVAEHTLATSCIIKAPSGTDNAFGPNQQGTLIGHLPVCGP